MNSQMIYYKVSTTLGWYLEIDNVIFVWFFLSVCAVNVSVTEIDKKKSARKHICPRSVFV